MNQIQEQAPIQDYVHLRGSLRIAMLDPEGKIIEERLVKNTVALTGRAWILGQLETTNQVTSQTISYMAIGSGTVAPVTGNTGLGNEVTRLAIGTFNTVNLTANPPSFDSVTSFATNLANTQLAEVGLFNSSAVGTLIARATFASFTKATSNTLSITYTLSD